MKRSRTVSGGRLFPSLALVGILVLTILNSSPARGDGISFTLAEERAMYIELSQKAVISCVNPGREVMYLATRLKSTTPMRNHVWLVPILSRTPPVVEAADEKIFQYFDDMVEDLFYENSYHGYYGKVTEHESLEIGVYDIHVLEADSADELAQWLEDRGYSPSEEVKAMLAQYVEKGAYFIVNRIDLENVYSDELARLEAVFPGFGEKSLEDQNLLLSNLLYDYPNIFTTDIADQSVSYETSVIGPLMTREEFRALREMYLSTEDDYCWEYYDRKREILGTIYDLRSILYRLHNGYYTPLKISFEPDECFFPLKISSLAPDQTMEVQVAVIAPQEMRDQNEILRTDIDYWYYGSLDENIVIDSDDDGYSWREISNLLDPGELPRGKKVTFFLWDTTPDQFLDDAVFIAVDEQNANQEKEQEEQNNNEEEDKWTIEPGRESLTATFQPVRGHNLVGNPFAVELCAEDLGLGDNSFWVYDPDSGDRWLETQCLAPCTAAFITVSGADVDPVTITGPAADGEVCRSEFADELGWRLVALPEFVGDRNAAGPFSLSSKRYHHSSADVAGNGYWVLLK